MCGGYAAKLDKIPKNELNNFFSPLQVQKFQATGKLQSFFWDKRPVLPVEIENKIYLFDWGNRDKTAPFPQTGWAKKNSIDKGKWRWLHPKEVNIPIDRGYEKRVWFDLEKGTKGLLVEIEGDRRIYMVTDDADDQYLKETGHNRMPIGPKKNFKRLYKK